MSWRRRQSIQYTRRQKKTKNTRPEHHPTNTISTPSLVQLSMRSAHAHDERARARECVAQVSRKCVRVCVSRAVCLCAQACAVRETTSKVRNSRSLRVKQRERVSQNGWRWPCRCAGTGARKGARVRFCERTRIAKSSTRIAESRENDGKQRATGEHILAICYPYVMCISFSLMSLNHYHFGVDG